MRDLLTSVTAGLKYNSNIIATCRELQITTSKEALPTTRQGDLDTSFIRGLRNTSADATLFYRNEDSATISLFDSMYDDGTTLDDIEIIFYLPSGKNITADCILTKVGFSIPYGDAIICEASLQISGKPTQNF